MARTIDKRIMLDLIIEAKKTDPEKGPFSEWLAEYLVDHLPTLTQPNEPLTIEQLREMVAKPVYLSVYDTAISSGWHIIKVVTEEKIIFRGWNAVYVPVSGIGLNFDLYAYPPAHIDREAWEPCLFCCEERKGRKTLAFDEAGDAVTIEIDGNAAAIESNSMGFIIKFCPECGRPLTDKAWAELEKRIGGAE